MIVKDFWVLFLSPLIIILAYYHRKKRDNASIRFSSGDLVSGFRPNLRTVLSGNLIYVRCASALLFLFALARPQIPLDHTRIETEGIDIVLAVDASGSMLAEDFKIGVRRQNRLEVVKKVVEDFIRKRKSDRIGMVAFAARAYTVCPLTLDHDWLVTNLERVKIGAIEDGTAVGSAIGSSLNRLKDTEAKSKIIILLTDGVNNAGKVSPLQAAKAAKALGIKIYAVGAGTKGLVPFPMRGMWGQKVYQNVKIEIDEDTLKKIAGETGGRYYRATDTESLREIYKEIDALETTPVEETGFREYKEIFSGFLLLGLALLMIELVLSNTVLRRIP